MERNAVIFEVIFLVFFRASFGKFGHNPSHPQKLFCSYTYERSWAFRTCTDCKR